MDMTLIDLEEALESVFELGFRIETDDDGQIVIHTGLTENEEGDLVPVGGVDSECEEFDNDHESYDESDNED